MHKLRAPGSKGAVNGHVLDHVAEVKLPNVGTAPTPRAAVVRLPPAGLRTTGGRRTPVGIRRRHDKQTECTPERRTVHSGTDKRFTVLLNAIRTPVESQSDPAAGAPRRRPQANLSCMKKLTKAWLSEIIVIPTEYWEDKRGQAGLFL